MQARIKYLGVCEEELGSREETQYAENDKESPFDIHERGWNEETDGEIE